MAAIFNNGNPQANQLWNDGTNEPLTQITGATSTSGHALSTSAQISGWPTSSSYTWSGGIDEVAIYNTALTAAQIESHYYAARDMTPLLNDRPLAYYRMNELAGTSAADTSG